MGLPRSLNAPITGYLDKTNPTPDQVFISLQSFPSFGTGDQHIKMPNSFSGFKKTLESSFQTFPSHQIGLRLDGLVETYSTQNIRQVLKVGNGSPCVPRLFDLTLAGAQQLVFIFHT